MFPTVGMSITRYPQPYWQSSCQRVNRMFQFVISDCIYLCYIVIPVTAQRCRRQASCHNGTNPSEPGHTNDSATMAVM